MEGIEPSRRETLGFESSASSGSATSANLVRSERLELSHPKVLVPKTNAATDYATSAKLGAVEES